MNCIISPPTAVSHFGCAWVIWANLAKLTGVCLLHLLTASTETQSKSVRERQTMIGTENEPETDKKKESQIIPGGAVLSCGLPFCQVAQWRDGRTPGQLIKVRCGWMPGVTHDPCSAAPRKIPTQHTHKHSTGSSSTFSSFIVFLYLPVSGCYSSEEDVAFQKHSCMQTYCTYTFKIRDTCTPPTNFHPHFNSIPFNSIYLPARAHTHTQQMFCIYFHLWDLHWLMFLY